MDTPTLIAFAITFVGGPIICAALLQLPARLWSIGGLAFLVGLAIVAANQMQKASDTVSYRPLAALWLAWVLGVAMVALALHRRITARNIRRWITLTAILATTLPWFGLATAQMMV